MNLAPVSSASWRIGQIMIQSIRLLNRMGQGKRKYSIVEGASVERV